MSKRYKSFMLPKEINSHFMYYYLKHIKPVVEAMATGTTFKELSGATTAQLPLVVAPLNEQKRIADKLDTILTRVGACRQRLDRVPVILKRFRQAVLAAATSGKLTEEWRESRNDKLYTKTGISVYDDERLELIADSWIWMPFTEIAEIKSNLVDPKKLPESIHLAPNHIEGGSGRVLEISTVEKDKVKSNKHQFHKGQIIYSKIRPYLEPIQNLFILYFSLLHK